MLLVLMCVCLFFSLSCFNLYRLAGTPYHSIDFIQKYIMGLKLLFHCFQCICMVFLLVSCFCEKCTEQTPFHTMHRISYFLAYIYTNTYMHTHACLHTVYVHTRSPFCTKPFYSQAENLVENIKDELSRQKHAHIFGVHEHPGRMKMRFVYTHLAI